MHGIQVICVISVHIYLIKSQKLFLYANKISKSEIEAMLNFQVSASSLGEEDEVLQKCHKVTHNEIIHLRSNFAKL